MNLSVSVFSFISVSGHALVLSNSFNHSSKLQLNCFQASTKISLLAIIFNYSMYIGIIMHTHSYNLPLQMYIYSFTQSSNTNILIHTIFQYEYTHSHNLPLQIFSFTQSCIHNHPKLIYSSTQSSATEILIYTIFQ